MFGTRGRHSLAGSLDQGSRLRFDGRSVTYGLGGTRYVGAGLRGDLSTKAKGQNIQPSLSRCLLNTILCCSGIFSVPASLAANG